MLAASGESARRNIPMPHLRAELGSSWVWSSNAYSRQSGLCRSLISADPTFEIAGPYSDPDLIHRNS
jgi:hypothetical protein